MPHDRGRDTGEDRDRFEHMLAAAQDALTFAQDRSREDLDRDPMLRRALLNCVQVIGEAAARTSMDGQRRAPQLPWPKMIGMRHILVHAYFDIDLDAVWRVVQDHLPSLVEDLQAVLAGWR